jgi:hypothetical protein
MLDAGLYFSYFLFFVALGVSIILPMLSISQNPKSLIKSGMGVGALLLVFVIAYVLSGSEVTLKYTLAGVGEGSSKLIGAGLIMFYITILAAIVGLIYSGVNKALK